MKKSFSIFPSLLAAALSATMVTSCTKKEDRTGSAQPDETNQSGESSQPDQTAQDQGATEQQPAPGATATGPTVAPPTPAPSMVEPEFGNPEVDKNEPGGRRSETAKTGRNGRSEPAPLSEPSDPSDPSEVSQGEFPEDEETAIGGSGIDGSAGDYSDVREPDETGGLVEDEELAFDPDAGYPASPDYGLDAGGVMEEGDDIYAEGEMGGIEERDQGVGGTGRTGPEGLAAASEAEELYGLVPGFKGALGSHAENRCARPECQRHHVQVIGDQVDEAAIPAPRGAQDSRFTSPLCR